MSVTTATDNAFALRSFCHHNTEKKVEEIGVPDKMTLDVRQDAAVRFWTLAREKGFTSGDFIEDVANNPAYIAHVHKLELKDAARKHFRRSASDSPRLPKHDDLSYMTAEARDELWQSLVDEHAERCYERVEELDGGPLKERFDNGTKLEREAICFMLHVQACLDEGKPWRTTSAKGKLQRLRKAGFPMNVSML